MPNRANRIVASLNFQTGTGTVLGGFIFGGRSVRVGRMMKTLSERIASGI